MSGADADPYQAVRELPRDEVAAAFYASDWPYLRKRLSRQEAESWIGQGLARLGPERVREIADQVRDGSSPYRMFGEREGFKPRKYRLRKGDIQKYQGGIRAAARYFGEREAAGEEVPGHEMPEWEQEIQGWLRWQPTLSELAEAQEAEAEA
jgi:hypothetical protein